MQEYQQLSLILTELLNHLRSLLGDHIKEAILFGSYARNEAEKGSDIDVLILVDLSREELPKYTWRLGEVASNLMLEHGVMVSPILENNDYFMRHADILPLFRNVRDEGVKISA